MTRRVSTTLNSLAMPASAKCIRRWRSKYNGVVTTSTVGMPSSRAVLTIAGAAASTDELLLTIERRQQSARRCARGVPFGSWRRHIIPDHRCAMTRCLAESLLVCLAATSAGAQGCIWPNCLRNSIMICNPRPP
jgi:hypothetical protein